MYGKIAVDDRVEFININSRCKNFGCHEDFSPESVQDCIVIRSMSSTLKTSDDTSIFRYSSDDLIHCISVLIVH